MMQTPYPQPTEFGPDYELIDSGGFEKLERFGRYVLRRPEPQAVWPKGAAAALWEKADAWFRRDADNSERGEWLCRKGMPDQWTVRCDCRGVPLTMRLGMTSFKHVGIFPEQAANWQFIFDAVKSMRDSGNEHPAVLNLFAYTGGASLAARGAGAEVTHLDAVRQVVSWANENMQLSGLDNIRWLVEDAMVYLKRETRRGRKYNGIILDPPAYGRGPKGEKWILEEGIAPLMEACGELLDPSCGFIVLNLYSMGFAPSVADNLLRNCFPYAAADIDRGELSFRDRAGNVLPLSVYARFFHKNDHI